MTLTKVQQAIFGILIVILAGVLARFVVYADKVEMTEQVKKEIDDLDLAIGNAKRIRDSAKQIEEEMLHLKDQLNKLKKILPMNINKPKFFQDIRRIGNEQGLEIELAYQNKPYKDQEIVEHPFTFKVRGNYHDLGNFFAKLSNYPRIVNVKGLNIETNDKNPAYSLDSSFIVSVFTYHPPTDEELARQIEAKKLERQGGDKNQKGKKRRR
ncbi:MAG: hypothetical protein CSA81_06855 [Acidobacteria bacterium]|nr:MAG: hypothetical protein CSA81_06855 [Acidobacteriota bacterium]PIE90615.1 MAG: hypothetical protein CR997_05075 [Acidobacteriota bacterium]